MSAHDGGHDMIVSTFFFFFFKIGTVSFIINGLDDFNIGVKVQHTGIQRVILSLSFCQPKKRHSREEKGNTARRRFNIYTH